MADFIELIDDGEHFTCRMPHSEQIVQVKMKDGTVRLAWYDCNIMDAGDWDFIPIEPGEDEPDIGRDSIADQIVAWREAEDAAEPDIPPTAAPLAKGETD